MENISQDDDNENPDSIIQQFTNWLQSSAIEGCQSDLPSDYECYKLSYKLTKDYSKISYEEYIEYRKSCPESLRKYMKPNLFLYNALILKDEGKASFNDIIS